MDPRGQTQCARFTAIAVALGFLTSVSLPAFATPTVNGVVKSDELSAAKKKKKKGLDGEEVQPRRDRPLRRQEEKEEGLDGEKSSLGATDLSAAKKKKKKKDSMEK